MGIEGNDRAILTARANAARADASRLGWAPVDTEEAFYVWSNEVGMTSHDITTSWTEEVR